MISTFQKIYIVSLARKRAQLQQPKEWPFHVPATVFDAVDGAALPAPKDWNEGPGAWGCLQSHRRVLEDAILKGFERILILEDDYVFIDQFEARLLEFLHAVPEDWEGLMLGGQHTSEPVEVCPGVVKCMETQRTHGYALRGRYLREAYQELHSRLGHADHLYAAIQFRFNVYAPDKFIVGQRAGPSEIDHRDHVERFWHSAGTKIFWLTSSREVATHLRPGYFFGRMMSGLGIEPRLQSILLTPRPTDRRIEMLRTLVAQLKKDAETRGKKLVLWCPGADMSIVREALCPDLVEIPAESVEDAMKLIEVQSEEFSPFG